ncbi:MAG: thioredoxin family protein [Candidatus Nanopelagicales bacterium]
MAVQSGRITLGTPLPDVTLTDLDGHSVNLAEYRGTDSLVVAFCCNHCPYVRHIEAALGVLVAEFDEVPVRFVAISSNDIAAYPDDDVAGLRDQAQRADWRFPYLQDLDQSAARAFAAACTPDFFVYSPEGTLAYRGAFDASSPKNNEPLTGDLLRSAISATLRGEPVPQPHRPALGCGIKWLPGNEPEAVSFT